jgi:hypothetical protein
VVKSINAILKIDIDENGRILKTEKHDKPKTPQLPKAPKTGGDEVDDELPS